jgi:hypothetical protein
MGMPSLQDPLDEQTKKLQIFIGNWDVEGKVNFVGKSIKVKGSWKITSTLVGWGGLDTGKLSIKTLGIYEEVTLLCFNIGEHMTHLFSSAHDHKGKWVDDEKLVLEYGENRQGKSYKEIIEIKVLNPKKFLIHEEDTLDGIVTSTMDLTFKKI